MRVGASDEVMKNTRKGEEECVVRQRESVKEKVERGPGEGSEPAAVQAI